MTNYMNLEHGEFSNLLEHFKQLKYIPTCIMYFCNIVYTIKHSNT